MLPYHSRVRVVPFDPAWESAFQAEEARIVEDLAGLELTIHHIGSTAVPGWRPSR